MRTGGDLQRLLHDAGLDHGGAGGCVDRPDAIEVACDVDDQSLADGIAGAGGASASGDDRQPDRQGGAGNGQ